MKRGTKFALFAFAAVAVAAAAWAVTRPAGAAAPPSGVITRWETWTKADGLPDDRTFAVLVAPEGVWAGTERGLALLDTSGAGRPKVAKTWTEAEGMSFPVVTSLCRDEKTGAVYAGTLRGVTRIQDGKATAIRQSADGLINDVVYSVCMEGRNLWCATAAGLSRVNVDTQKWDSWTEKNSPMKEIWCYSVCHRDGKVHVAIWGSGVLEYDVATSEWNLYKDPDGDMRFDLLRKDGLLSDVAVSVSYVGGTLWVGSYIGLSRYDGRDWATWTGDDSGLASSFLNSGRADGPEFWPCTDKGLGQFDGSRWVTYRRSPGGSGGKILVTPAEGGTPTTYETTTAIPDDFAWAVDFAGRDVWVATSGGLSRGLRNGPSPAEVAEGRRP